MPKGVVRCRTPIINGPNGLRLPTALPPLATNDDGEVSHRVSINSSVISQSAQLPLGLRIFSHNYTLTVTHSVSIPFHTILLQMKDFPMALFKTDEEAWSKFTHVLETRYGGNVSPNMIQVNTVMRPLSCTTKWPPLNLHRRQLVVDTIPSYSRANISPYVSTGARVSDNYEQYLLQLNVNLRKYAPAIDEREVERKLRAYERATRKLQEFDEDARREWWRALRKDPTLKRAVWENQWRYRDKRKPFEIKASDAYGEYLAEVVPYPPLFKVTKALRAYNDARFFAKLPIDEDEAEDGANDPDAKDGWAEFRKSVISVDVNDFMRNDAPEFGAHSRSFVRINYVQSLVGLHQ